MVLEEVILTVCNQDGPYLEEEDYRFFFSGIIIVFCHELPNRLLSGFEVTKERRECIENLS